MKKKERKKRKRVKNSFKRKEGKTYEEEGRIRRKEKRRKNLNDEDPKVE